MGLLGTFLGLVTQGNKAPLDKYRGYPGLKQLVESHAPNFKQLEVVAHDLGYPVVNVEMIVVKEDRRNQGIGDAFLSALCRWADENGVRLALTPSVVYGSKILRLRRWYIRHGFKRNTGRFTCHEITHSFVRPPVYLKGGPRKGYTCFGMPSDPLYASKVQAEIMTSISQDASRTPFRPFLCWEERLGAMVCPCGAPSELVSYTCGLRGRVVRCRACHEQHRE